MDRARAARAQKAVPVPVTGTALLLIFAPSDCIVSNTAPDNDHALRQIHTVLKGHIGESTRLTFRPTRRAAPGGRVRLGQALPNARE